MEHDGISPFQDFHITDSGVRDVGVDAGRPVPPWTRTRASSNRFVISPTGGGLSIVAFPPNAKREVTGNYFREGNPRFTLYLERTWCNPDWRHKRGMP